MKLLREALGELRDVMTSNIRVILVFVWTVLILFLCVIPLAFWTGFFIGLMNFENPFRTGVAILEIVVKGR